MGVGARERRSRERFGSADLIRADSPGAGRVRIRSCSQPASELPGARRRWGRACGWKNKASLAAAPGVSQGGRAAALAGLTGINARTPTTATHAARTREERQITAKCQRCRGTCQATAGPRARTATL